ncbi:FadR/GntR family transcriptional regulator [Algibacter lectus]|uniref:Transcriptional regulator n=1 Tax=Algibacter lectus TaxID=221126 RepID=A0A090WTV6_9FLAO|nr:FadR/GntR family transcriptional regulator [Algibacter lectus]MDO7136151.1 FadR/GntR family transcriptional regulator [Algibacter lectus]MWW23362.1 FCD domain-containing protein [Algibacter lectus]TDY63961.1 GntR family transcriptional regulator [Algibacter lectus]SFB82538.1 transcriptional regulator, GntR family [Algibacter lectus]GAL80441.1 transcriptional regulator [Algibacter lectus]
MNINVLSKNENQEITSIVKKLISQISDLITSKHLEPGDKLPAERVLAEKFGVSRRSVRVAILKLESYGILISMPQSGTFVANIGTIAMNGMVEDILSLGIPNFKSLVETRILLELKTVRLAANRRTDADLKRINKALNAHKAKLLAKEDAVQEDLLFHLAIAKASGNVTMNEIMIGITPQIIVDFKKYHKDYDTLDELRIREHTEIYEAIEDQDPDLAEKRMKEHFKLLYEYCDVS